MCGIAGIFNWNASAPIARAELCQAAARMALRGPDASGFHEMRGAAFAHRRLTVIDPEGGWQPMVDRRSRVCLTYNGEIYNFKELRRELTALGHSFASRSDTEVLLRAYLQWGRNCLEHLTGIFAFGIYDPREDILFLGRDRMGAKPLYYAETQDGLLFASSVAALLSFSGVGSELDSGVLMHYFSSIRTSMGGKTLLRNVRILEPGMGLVASRRRASSELFRYWEFPIIAADDKTELPFDEAAEAVRSLVQQSVREQMVSDVPLGGFLSGGLDSVIIASVAAKEGSFGAYNVGYGEHGCNEWPYVRLAAGALGVGCREIHLEADGFVDSWKFLLAQKGLPLSTPNEIPIYHLARELRADYTVALSGEGADEVFGGYVIPYFSAHDYDRARRSAPADISRLDPVGRALMRLYGQAHFSCHAEQHFMLNSWVSPAMMRAMLRPESGEGLTELFDFYDGLFARFDACSTLDKHMHLHARINLEGLLNRVDSSTMAASVEARVPFTDHRIAELLYSVPDSYRIALRDNAAFQQSHLLNVAEMDQRNLIESKRLLRAAFHNDIPQEILHRRKVSFPVPFREWLGGSLRDFATETLCGSELIGRVVHEHFLQEVVAGADNPAYGLVLWPLVNLALWEEVGLRQTAPVGPEGGALEDWQAGECLGLVG